MIENDKDKLRLLHIYDSIKKIEIVKTDLTYELYNADWMKQDIIIRNLEIIGEATRALSKEIQTKYPEVEWKKIKGMRNFLIHEYFNVDIEAVWKTIITDIPVLKTQVENILAEF